MCIRDSTYIRGCFGLYYDETASPELEGALWEIAQNDPDRQRRIMATQAWCGIARSPQAINTLDVYKRQRFIFFPPFPSSKSPQKAWKHINKPLDGIYFQIFQR